LCGNLVTLLIVQSKGWPFLAVMWGVLDFGLLHGSSKFVAHWLYWQVALGVFNEKNPGYVIYNVVSPFRIHLRTHRHLY
jgi:hypothetical protein